MSDASWVAIPIPKNKSEDKSETETPTNDQVYYYNKMTNRTSWVPESDESSDEESDDEDDDFELPGWKEKIENGKTVYYNEQANISTLVRPKYPKRVKKNKTREDLKPKSTRTSPRSTILLSNEPTLLRRNSFSSGPSSGLSIFHRKKSSPIMPVKALHTASSAEDLAYMNPLLGNESPTNSRAVPELDFSHITKGRSRSTAALEKVTGSFHKGNDRLKKLDIETGSEHKKESLLKGVKNFFKGDKSPKDKSSTTGLPPKSPEETKKDAIKQWNNDAIREGEEWCKTTEIDSSLKWEQKCFGNPDAHGSQLITQECMKGGFSLDFGVCGNESPVYTISGSERDKPYYKDFFENTDHTNYCAEDEKLGPVVVSIEGKSNPDQKILRAIIRTRKGDRRVAIIGEHEQVLPFTSKDRIRALKNTVPDISHLKFKTVKTHTEDMVSMLLSYEKKSQSKNYKFGVLYVKEGQKDENEWFNNNEESKAFKAFLSGIGDRVPLKGFSGYAGGLDTKKDTTGKEAVCAKIMGYEVIFHVSTMLPYFAFDEQHVERKRHIGNDVIVIIFKEGNDPFDPLLIASQFNHVFAVVSPMDEEGTQFRIAFANKFGVRPYEPLLPDPPVFKCGQELREFMLTKLINAERSAMSAPDFRQLLPKALENHLRNIIKLATSWKKETTRLQKATNLLKKEKKPKRDAKTHSEGSDSSYFPVTVSRSFESISISSSPSVSHISRSAPSETNFGGRNIDDE